MNRRGEDSLSAPAAAPSAERRISRYSLLEPIGAGLRGTVFRARRGNRLLALKLFNRGVGIDAAVLGRFTPGAPDVIAHPNLVPVEEVGEWEGQSYCAMALLRGDSLEMILAELRGERRGAAHLSPLGAGADGQPRSGFIQKAVAALLDVAEGLGRAHQGGVVHGRLGPRNLILGSSGRLVVTDFGAEGIRGGASRVGHGVSHDLSTLTYRAPEQIEPFQDSLNARVDVYALGVILYEILTRRPPYLGRNPQMLRDAISEGAFEPPSALEPVIAPEAEAVVLRAMALDPASRYSTAGELAADLRRLLQLETTRAGSALLGAAADGNGASTPRAERVTDAPAADEGAPEVPEADPDGEQSAGGPTAVAEMPARAETCSLAVPAAVAVARAVEVAVEAPAGLPAPGAGPALAIALATPQAARRRLRPWVGAAAVLAVALVSAWTWLTLFLHDSGERSRVRAATYHSGFSHLETAVLSLVEENPGRASAAVGEARQLGIGDPALDRIESALQKATGDPVLRDLAHPRPAVRREAIAALAREIEEGERPELDRRALWTCLGDGDPGVRESAIEALGSGPSSEPLLAAFPIGDGLPTLEVDATTLLGLLEALSRIADGPAVQAILSFRLEDFARLDEAAGGEAHRAPLALNLVVSLGPDDAGRLRAGWVRSRARLRSGELLELAERLWRGDAKIAPLAAEVIDGLADLGTREAAAALAGLAGPLQASHGERIAGALRRLGAVDELLALARAPFTDHFRLLAVRAAASALAAGPAAAPEEDPALALVELFQRDPDPEVRRAALRAWTDLPRAAARKAEDLRDVLPALSDPVLRGEALALLSRRPPREALPALLEVLRRGDGQLRLLAVDAIAAARDPAALVPLALLLHQDDPGVRAAALAAMRELGLARSLPLAAGILPASSPGLMELALEASRCPLEPDDRPALRLLALREALGLGGADDPPAALREARRALLRAGLPGSGGPEIHLPPRAAAVEAAQR